MPKFKQFNNIAGVNFTYMELLTSKINNWLQVINKLHITRAPSGGVDACLLVARFRYQLHNDNMDAMVNTIH